MKAHLLLTTTMLCAAFGARAALKPGDKIPDTEFTLTGGETARLSDYRGKWVVLYFYPRADTPGCTKESCSLRDGYDKIRERGAMVLGVSLDNQDRQEAFKDKYELPFDLVVDENKELTKGFDVLGTGGLMAKRVTFVIDPKGEIRHVFEKVDVGRHQEEVLEVLDRLAAESK